MKSLRSLLEPKKSVQGPTTKPEELFIKLVAVDAVYDTEGEGEEEEEELWMDSVCAKDETLQQLQEKLAAHQEHLLALERKVQLLEQERHLGPFGRHLDDIESNTTAFSAKLDILVERIASMRDAMRAKDEKIQQLQEELTVQREQLLASQRTVQQLEQEHHLGAFGRRPDDVLAVAAADNEELGGVVAGLALGIEDEDEELPAGAQGQENRPAGQLVLAMPTGQAVPAKRKV